MSDPEVAVPIEDSLSLHACPTLGRERVRAERALTVPPNLRAVDDPSAWPRRHLKLDGHDLLGDPEVDDGLSGGSTGTALQVSVLRLLRALARQLSTDQFGKDDCVSISAALDLAIRWYIQHPPQPDWSRGILTKWMFDHRRGRPSAKWITPIEDEAMRQGCSISEALTRRRAHRDRKLREMLEIMQRRDLNAEEASGGIPTEWIATGRLIIPDEVQTMVDMRDDQTPMLPFGTSEP